ERRSLDAGDDGGKLRPRRRHHGSEGRCRGAEADERQPLWPDGEPLDAGPRPRLVDRSAGGDRHRLHEPRRLPRPGHLLDRLQGYRPRCRPLETWLPVRHPTPLLSFPQGEIMTVPSANWSYPTAVKFGPGRIRELADHCKAVGMKRPLLVTDKALASLPITGQALDILDAAGLGRAVFSEVDPNPNEMNMEAGLKVYRAGGHDGVVCFGGGSALDLGKMIALMVDQTVPVWDLEDIGDWWTRADGS